MSDQSVERLTGAVVGKKGTFVSGDGNRRMKAALLEDDEIEEMEAATDDRDS